MEMTIGKYIIRSDGNCVTLYKKRMSEKAGIEVEKIVGHYSFIGHALLRFIDEKVADSDAKDTKELLKALDEIKEEIDKLVKTERSILKEFLSEKY